MNKCKWCNTKITAEREFVKKTSKLKLYCNSSCKAKYRHKHLTPEEIKKKRKRDQDYRDNLSEKKKKERREYDKVYDKKRWKNTLANPIKHKAKKVNDKEWRYIYYRKHRKRILDRRKFLRNQRKALGK